MAFNDTFNNISILSWLCVLLVVETGVPEENHWPSASHWQTFSDKTDNNERQADPTQKKKGGGGGGGSVLKPGAREE